MVHKGDLYTRDDPLIDALPVLSIIDQYPVKFTGASHAHRIHQGNSAFSYTVR